MRLDTILERITLSGIPFEHHEFKGTKKNPVPAPPYGVWFATETPRGADISPNLLSQVDMAIELYTETPDAGAIAELETAVLSDVEYKRFQTPIPGENLIQTAYEVTFLQKIKRSETA